jgi:hypothetical protein
MSHYTEKTNGLPLPPATSSKPAWRHLADQTGESQASLAIPKPTTGKNQHSPLGIMTPHLKKKKKKEKEETRN